MEGLALGAALGLLAAFLGEVRASAPLLLALLALGGLLGAFGTARRVFRVGCGLLVAVLSLTLLTPVLRGPLNALTLSQLPVPADAVVVLGGGVQCGTRALAPTSAAPAQLGLQLGATWLSFALVPSRALGPNVAPVRMAPRKSAPCSSAPSERAPRRFGHLEIQRLTSGSMKRSDERCIRREQCSMRWPGNQRLVQVHDIGSKSSQCFECAIGGFFAWCNRRNRTVRA